MLDPWLSRDGMKNQLSMSRYDTLQSYTFSVRFQNNTLSFSVICQRVYPHVNACRLPEKATVSEPGEQILHHTYLHIYMPIEFQKSKLFLDLT